MLVPIHGAQDLEPFAGAELLADFDSALLEQQRPDAHWLLLADGPAARCSLWWLGAPQLPGETLGLIGHFAARSEEATRTLLEHACSELAARGCTLAVGPMDGTTWQRYRFITERGREPPFFLEPDNPDRYPQHWLAAGFRPLAHYSSAGHDDLSLELPRLGRILERLEAGGIRIRPLRLAAFEDELRAIYRVTVPSFANAFLYTPIDEDVFLSLYRQLKPYLQPELCLIATKTDDATGADIPVGYLFALPDMLQAQRGDVVDTFIIKTVAVLPTYASRGLGSALVARVLQTGRRLGYRRAIHALMHQSNASQTMSRFYQGQRLRRYTLFARKL